MRDVMVDNGGPVSADEALARFGEWPLSDKDKRPSSAIRGSR